MQEKYGSFKRALKVRVLRLKLRHELKMKGLSDEAKKLDEKIQAHFKLIQKFKIQLLGIDRRQRTNLARNS